MVIYGLQQWERGLINLILSQKYSHIINIKKITKIVLIESIDSPMFHLNFKQAKILVAEDNILNQQIIKEILEQQEITVTIAKEKSFDLILMDIEMPELDGYQTTETLRKNNITTPIIAMTAHAMEQDKQKALLIGMNDYISKPINIKTLFNKIKQYIHYQQPVFTIHSEIQLSVLDRLNNNKKLLKNLLLQFKYDYQNIIEKLQQQDYTNSKKTLHSLKGVAGNLSLIEVIEATKYAQKSFRQYFYSY